MAPSLLVIVLTDVDQVLELVAVILEETQLATEPVAFSPWMKAAS
jgi:hypothetical protein